MSEDQPIWLLRTVVVSLVGVFIVLVGLSVRASVGNPTLILSRTLEQDSGIMLISRLGVSGVLDGSQQGLMKTLFVKAKPGDTLMIPNVVPSSGSSFVMACCGEAGYQYDSINGLFLFIPAFVEPSESYTISFEGEKISNGTPVKFRAFNRTVGNKLVFSRSMELRLLGNGDNDNVEYATAGAGLPYFQKYNKPLLISKTTTVYARLLLSNGKYTGYSKIELIRSNDVVAIDCSASPLSKSVEEVDNSSLIDKDVLLNLMLNDTLQPINHRTYASWKEKEMVLIFDRATLKPFNGIDFLFLKSERKESIARISFYRDDGSVIKGDYLYQEMDGLLKVRFCPASVKEVRFLKVKFSRSLWQQVLGRKMLFSIVGIYIYP